MRAGARPAPVTRAEVIVNPGNTVVQGTMIQAVTETALDSTLPGAIRAIVSEDVHSFDGTRVLIPRGRTSRGPLPLRCGARAVAGHGGLGPHHPARQPDRGNQRLRWG